MLASRRSVSLLLAIAIERSTLCGRTVGLRLALLGLAIGLRLAVGLRLPWIRLRLRLVLRWTVAARILLTV